MSKFLFAILILYLLPLVISTIGFYLFDFKGHMDDFTPLPYILCPVSNILFGILAILIACYQIIAFPIKVLNKKYKVWDKIQKIRIK